MKSLCLCLATTGLISATSALHFVWRETPSVVRLQTERKTVRDPIKRDAIRRRQTISESLDNEATLYFANITLGTPGQDLRLHLDTGSSDLWVNSGSSRICSFRTDPCSTSGVYDANSSSTYGYVSSDFEISYVDGSGAAGDYVTDTLTFGGETLDDFQFGVGYDSSSPEGILGIGYTANEAQVNRGRGNDYPNLPQAMVDAGLIQSNAYSLWLDDLDSSSGSILFGGVDTDKYYGQLQSLPIQRESQEYSEFLITLSAMSLSNNGRNTSLSAALPTAVILDSGSSLIYLPNDLTSAIYNALQISYSDRQQTAFVDCGLADENITLDFTFTSPTISVPISELVISPYASGPGDEEEEEGEEEEEEEEEEEGSGYEYQGGSGNSGGADGSLCIFGIAPAEGSMAVLGDTFLRSAYVVYDLANNEISLAQTNFNSTQSRVSEIGTGTDSVPNATPVGDAVQAAASGTGGARIGGITGTATAGGSTATRESGAGPALASHLKLTLAASLGIAVALL